MVTMRACHDANAVCAALGFEITPRWEVKRVDDGIVFGRLETIVGKSIRAICRHAHGPTCATIINSYGKERVVEADLVKWLIAGHACNAVAHTELSRTLRRNHGHKVRG